MLVLSSQSRLLGSNPIVWLCDQEPVKSFQKGPPPEKAKLKRWWTYLSQFRLTVHHITGIQNELSDYIWRSNFHALIGESSEALAKEAFQRMDVQLDLSMRTAGILEGWSLTDHQSEYCCGLFLGNSTALLCLFVSQNPKSKIPIDKPRRIFRRGTNNNTISKT